jgi:EAL domain-containing protein (putative c-di-GMP-specific phosphodiesterase class I)/AmiR/NasT family two-component response regulator
MAGVPVRVLIADNQQFSAAGTAAALDSQDEFELVGVAEDASEAAALAGAGRPDVALVHSCLPGGGEAAVRAILSAAPGARVLAHSGVTDQELVVEMLRAGASGYVARDAPAERITSSLRQVAEGDTVFDDALELSIREQQRARIRAVMDLEELDVVFQPIVELDSREVVGYEALSRFSGEPHRGPQEWFAEAHEVGLGPELELWAIRKACERSERLPEGMFMAVNVSPVTTERPELLALLAGCHVERVVLEVTEHARVDDYPRFRIAIERVRKLGATLAVDDAGAGFASLRHILELDAELIKLDGSLTRSLDEDPRGRSLASAVIAFGRESGASVLAEHVETEGQVTELRRLGVDYGQGYHLGRPKPLPAPAQVAAGSRFCR